MFNNFLNSFQALRSYYELKILKFYYISLHILRVYVYFFLSNFPEATFIQGATSIPDSRVLLPTQGDWINEVQPPRLGDYTNISYLNLLDKILLKMYLCVLHYVA